METSHPQKRSLGRKFLWVFFAFALFVGATLAALPWLLNLDRYRPLIVQAVNERINGRFELGKLQLSLWGQIRVDVGGVSLVDAAGKPVLKVQDAYLHIPLATLIQGSPVLTFRMNRPEVQLVKSKQGQLNVLQLMKPTEPAAATPSQKTELALPALALRSKLGIELNDSHLSYRDEATGLETKFERLNFRLKDISLQGTTELEAWADLDTKMGKDLTVKGPARLTGKFRPEIRQGKLEEASIRFKLDLDSLHVRSAQAFEKRPGVVANAEGSLRMTETEARIEAFVARFASAELKVDGAILNLKETSPVVQLQISTNEIGFAPWAELVPALREYALSGSAKLNAEVTGPSDKLAYRGGLSFQKVSAKAPGMKSPPVIDGRVSFENDRIPSLALQARALGTEIRLQGSVTSFSSPNIALDLSADRIDLDQMGVLPPPTPTAQTAAEAKREGAPASSAESPKAVAEVPAGEGMDRLLDPLRTNVWAEKTQAAMVVKIGSIRARGVEFKTIHAKLGFKNMEAFLQDFGMQAFGGSLGASFALQAKPKVPTYRFSAEVKDLDLKQAVSSQYAFFKNTLLGRAQFKVEGRGASLNTTPAKKNLSAKGSLRVDKATFATIDVGKMALDALNQSLERAASKFPPLQGKKIGGSLERESRYEKVTASFTIEDGVFNSPDFAAVAEPRQGIDLKGSTRVGLIDQSLKARWEVIDTYNFTHARDLSIEYQGVRVENLLAEGNGPVRFPVNVNCTVSVPCYSYTDVPEHLASVAVNKVTGAATAALKSKAEQEVRKRISPDVEKKARDTIQGLGKKLFGR